MQPNINSIFDFNDAVSSIGHCVIYAAESWSGAMGWHVQVKFGSGMK